MRRQRVAILVVSALLLCPLVAHAQPPGTPIVGVLDSGTPEAIAPSLAAFRKGLEETGFVDGRNVRIEYRHAEGRYDRLPALAAELVRIPVAVLAATGVTAATAAKKSTTTIPVVFHTGGDAVRFGLVSSLNKPGGNVTGVVSLGKIVMPKQLEVLRELLPKVDAFAFLVNPANAVAKSDTSNVRDAAQEKGVRLHIVEAKTPEDIDAAFTTMAQRKVGALVVQVDPFFDARRAQIAALALRHAIPAIAAYPEFAAAGGLVSYGTDRADAYRIEGTYVGRILKGAKPADLPVQQAVKLEMVINTTTARTLGVTVPPSLQMRANRVLE